MAGKKIYSLCGMCTVWCQILAEVMRDKIDFLQGNRISRVEGSLCARGSDGMALIEDPKRPQYPMSRAGEQNEDKWRRVSWDEALNYTAERAEGRG